MSSNQKNSHNKKAKQELKSYVALLGSDRKVLAMVIAVVIVAAAVLIGVGVLIGSLTGNEKETDVSTAVTEETVQSETTEQSQAETIPEEVPQVALEKDAYPEINDLITRYYQATADGDIETIKSLKDYTEEEELLRIEKKSVYIEEYQNLECYTKQGPLDGTWLVYAVYDVKFANEDTPVPGMTALYVCTNEDGSYYIHDGELDDAVADYLAEISAQDDVIELNNKVQVRYNEAINADAQLAAYLEQMTKDVKAAVGEELAATEAESTQSAEGETSQSTGEGEFAAGTQVKTTDVVNVRSSDSEEADRIGQAEAGQEFTILESKANGWSKIEFEGQEAYIKSEFLTPSDSADTSQEESAEDTSENSGSDESSDTSSSSSSSSNVPNSGEYRVEDTLNIRKSASESAEKLAVVYPGETVEILMKQADGWTRVRYNGETGYIKSDLLK